MSDKNEKQHLFRNEDTLLRRAWIESALRGVRSSLKIGADTPEFGERASTDVSATVEQNSGARLSGTASRRPPLYVAWSASRRR